MMDINWQLVTRQAFLLLAAAVPFAAFSVETAVGAAPVSAEGTVLAQKEIEAPASRSELFGEDEPPTGQSAAKGAQLDNPWRGFLQGKAARAYKSPVHWSNLLIRADLAKTGQLRDNIKWKIEGRFDYDAAYDLFDFYPPAVKRDQRADFMLRENYLDISSGALEYRLGRQHVVWGEMVGLFFADVVSARDLREFLLPDFDILRIPQWAARVEYFKGDFHAELLWVPVPSYDVIGKPGAEFYPIPIPPPPGFVPVIKNEERPSRTLANTNYGFRLSTLSKGWDISGFYYRSMDVSPTFFRQVILAPTPTVFFEPRHLRIQQLGGTVSKDLGSFVLRGEAVYTKGRQFNVFRLTQSDGLVPQNTLDYALGLDFPFGNDGRFNAQFFQRVFFNHDPDTLFDQRESGVTFLVSRKFGRKLEGEALLIRSLNRSDWMFRPKLTWSFERNWRVAFGLDVFHGPPTGFFGRYSDKDRVYTELRYDF